MHPVRTSVAIYSLNEAFVPRSEERVRPKKELHVEYAVHCWSVSYQLEYLD